MDKLRGTSWWTIAKSLPFYGGASATKWVYIGTAYVVNLAIATMTGSICYMFVRYGVVNMTLCSLDASTITAVVGFAAHATNKRREANLQQGRTDASKPN
jgi:hypothetical protein